MDRRRGTRRRQWLQKQMLCALLFLVVRSLVINLLLPCSLLRQHSSWLQIHTTISRWYGPIRRLTGVSSEITRMITVLIWCPTRVYENVQQRPLQLQLHSICPMQPYIVSFPFKHRCPFPTHAPPLMFPLYRPRWDRPYNSTSIRKPEEIKLVAELTLRSNE